MSDDDDSLICPITHELFRDPVIAEDGRSYEREAITRWINEHGTSPFTRQALDINRLQPDEEIRKKADQRRRLSVTYNRYSDQVELPRNLSPSNTRLDNRPANIEYQREPTYLHTCCQDIRCACRHRDIRIGEYCECIRDTCVSRLSAHPNCLLYVCLAVGVLSTILVVSIRYGLSQNTKPMSTSVSYENPPSACYALNHTLTANTCIASFTNITYMTSGTCNDFTYQRNRYNFIALSSHTTIIFAFQQTFGYWDIDDITLWDYNNNQNIFQNGDFESGSLPPSYSQCQSAGSISNSSQFNGRYCYSDHTNGQFGYLMQNVSTTVGSLYYMDFYLQNRYGSGSSYMVLLGT